MDKPPYSQHLEDEARDGERHEDQDQHAKNITAKTITAKRQRDDERHDDQDAINAKENKDGGHEREEERDASYQLARRRTRTHNGNHGKTHNGKGVNQDLSQHDGDKDTREGLAIYHRLTCRWCQRTFHKSSGLSMHICFALKPARRVFGPGGEPTKELNHGKTHHGSIKEARNDNGNDEAENGNDEAEPGNGNNENVTGNGGATEANAKDPTQGQIHYVPHHGAPSKGPDEEEQEGREVDGGKHIQAREEPGRYGANAPTKKAGEGDKQGTRAGGGGGGDM